MKSKAVVAVMITIAQNQNTCSFWNQEETEMKKSIAFLAAAVIGLSALPVTATDRSSTISVCAAQSKTQIFGDFEYTPYTNYAEINKYTGSETTVELPSEINGLKVTKIADSGLCNNKTLEKLIIPEGITEIGQYAISHNDNLKEIQFPSTLQTIGFTAISYNKSLTEVHLPEGLKKMDSGVFFSCYGLTDIYIPSSVESIGDLATYCYDLKNFHVDENNHSYCDIDGILYSKDQTILVRYPEHRSAATYIIPETVTELADSAFESDKDLEKIEIPDTVTTIGERCFSMCANLKSIKLPHGITEISDYCLGASDKLEEIYIPKSVASIGFTAFYNYSDFPLKIYYEGTQDEWNHITIGKNNTGLEDAEWIYSYSFGMNETIKGDINTDGTFDVTDVVLLQKWLLGVSDVELLDWEAADFYEDGILNVFDLCMMKRKFIRDTTNIEAPILLTDYEEYEK